VTRLTRLVIAECVSQESWQTFRKSLKGVSTEAKLSGLRDWIRSGPPGEYSTRLIQVQNYLNALARGGFIVPTIKRCPIWEQIEEARVLK
jgi:hypothetical protein